MELYPDPLTSGRRRHAELHAASERSFVSQPALTKAIQRLEEAIGGRLFDRTKNSVQLTGLGQAMLPTFRQIFDSANRAREEARRLVRARSEVVRVGVMCMIDLHQVLPGFVESQDGRTEVELRFREGNLGVADRCARPGRRGPGRALLALRAAGRFAAAPLFAEEYVLAIGDDHRFNGRTSVDVAELDRERYCERVMCEFSTYIEHLLRERGVRLEVVQQSAREDWIQAWCGRTSASRSCRRRWRRRPAWPA